MMFLLLSVYKVVTDFTSPFPPLSRRTFSSQSIQSLLTSPHFPHPCQDVQSPVSLYSSYRLHPTFPIPPRRTFSSESVYVVTEVKSNHVFVTVGRLTKVVVGHVSSWSAPALPPELYSKVHVSSSLHFLLGQK